MTNDGMINSYILTWSNECLLKDSDRIDGLILYDNTYNTPMLNLPTNAT